MEQDVPDDEMAGEEHSGEAGETSGRTTRSQTRKEAAEAEPASDPEEEDEEEEEWEVERIVQKRFREDETPEYLIKWVGYEEEENTWEPRVNLTHCQELLDEFEETLMDKEEEGESATPKRDIDDVDSDNEKDDSAETKKRKKENKEPGGSPNRNRDSDNMDADDEEDDLAEDTKKMV